MGDISAFVLSIGAVLIALGLLLGWINYKIDKLKEEDKLNIEMVGSIIVLEKAMKKLNEALKSHDRRLNRYLHEISDIKDRIDILEEGHPDSDIDYATVDDNDEVIGVWFEGKRYVPEDKKDEDTNTFYANNKVVAETTRPEEKHCCATCQHYRPGEGHTCALCYRLHVTGARANMAESACHNYEAVLSDKSDVKYICFDKKVDDLQLKIDYITLCQEQDKLRNKEIGFNKLLSSAIQSGIMSAREWREFMEDLDSDT